MDPAQDGEDVVEGGRERVVGSESIVGADHEIPGLAGEAAALPVVERGAAGHPAAAVQPEQNPGGGQPVEPFVAVDGDAVRSAAGHGNVGQRRGILAATAGESEG